MNIYSRDLKELDFHSQDCRRHRSLQEHPWISQPTDAQKLCQKQMEGECRPQHSARACVSFTRSLSLALHLSVYTLSSQQAFNATAVIRHMRRLQLGTSFGSSIQSNNSVSNPQSRAPSKSQSVDCAPLSLKDCEWHFRCSLWTWTCPSFSVWALFSPMPPSIVLIGSRLKSSWGVGFN